MRCTKCGASLPDQTRFCPVCGHKLQSDRLSGEEEPSAPGGLASERDAPSRLLDFQGWSRPGRGLWPYVEACLLAVILAGGAGLCLYVQVLWPLYPLVGLCGLVIWLRRL